VTARLGLHEQVGRRTVWIPNERPPWPLQAATLRERCGDLVEGLVPAGGEPVSVRFSPGVRTVFGAPQVLR
jgi:hypothetical protein